MAHTSPPVPTSLTVIFDGTCGFCTRWVRYMHKLDRHQRLTSVPCQLVVGDERFGLVDADCGESAWAIDDGSSGQRAAGAQAAMLIVATLLQRRWPVTVGRLPGVRHVLAFGYRTIARNRYRLPGDAPPLGSGTCGRPPTP